MKNARRHYIESQLSPIVQAFGFEGYDEDGDPRQQRRGWGVERRGPKRKGLAELEALARELPPWPCTRPGCERTIRWEPRKSQARFRKYCSSRCRHADYMRQYLAARPDQREKALQRRRRWYRSNREAVIRQERERRARDRAIPERLARARELGRLAARRYRAAWTQEQLERVRERKRLDGRRRLARMRAERATAREEGTHGAAR